MAFNDSNIGDLPTLMIYANDIEWLFEAWKKYKVKLTIISLGN